MGEEKPSGAHLALTKMASADLCLRVAALPPSLLCSGDSVSHCDRQNWTQVAAAYSAVCSAELQKRADRADQSVLIFPSWC